NIGECPVDKLVRSISLRLSTASPDTDSPPQAVPLQHQDDSHRPRMATPVVVSRPPS
ncbi:hypothetical protein NDU88_005602, partial [Pleurodeles waltl]